jgi:hypothetical protein
MSSMFAWVSVVSSHVCSATLRRTDRHPRQRQVAEIVLRPSTTNLRTHTLEVHSRQVDSYVSHPRVNQRTTPKIESASRHCKGARQTCLRI